LRELFGWQGQGTPPDDGSMSTEDSGRLLDSPPRDCMQLGKVRLLTAMRRSARSYAHASDQCSCVRH
jgi:hypothetical protein